MPYIPERIIYYGINMIKWLNPLTFCSIVKLGKVNSSEHSIFVK